MVQITSGQALQIGVIFLAIASWAKGHDSPVHRIDALDQRIQTQGAGVDSYLARAYEYQSLGDWAKALTDFESAHKLNPESRVALQGCVTMLIRIGDFDRARSFLNHGLALELEYPYKANLYALLAQIEEKEGNWRESLVAWKQALKSPQPEIDWFLSEANCLTQLGLYHEKADALYESCQRNSSIVLRRAWIQSLVESGQYEAATREIETGLAKARWKSAWLLMRAQLRQQTHELPAMRDDARQAWLEIQSRLSSVRPDPYLVVQAAQALLFLEKPGQAKPYIRQAEDLGVSSARLAPLKEAMSGVNRSL